MYNVYRIIRYITFRYCGGPLIRLLVKLAIAFAAAVLIGGTVLVLALPSLLSSDFGRRQVSDYCSRYLNRPVTIGKVSFSWGEGLSITDAAVAEKDRTPLLNLSDLRLVISWGALLTGNVAVEAFEIDGADLILRRDKDGRLNISDLYTAPEAEATAKTGEQPPSNALPALLLKGSIRESALTFIDERLESTTRVQGLNAELFLPALNKPFSVRATCDVVLNDNPPEPVALNGAAELAPAGKLDLYKGKGSLEMKAGFGDLKLFFDLARLGGDEQSQAEAAKLSCSIDLQKLTRLMAGIVGLPPGFSLKGTLGSSLTTGGSLKSRVTIDGTTELKNFSVTGGPLQQKSFNQPRMVFSHNLSYYRQTDTVDITAFSLKGDFIDLDLSGKVSDVQKNPGGAIRLSGKGNLNEIVLLAGKLLSLPPDLKLSGNVNLALSAEGDLKGLAIKGTTDCKDLYLNAAFLNNRPFRAKSLKIGHDVGFALTGDGKKIDNMTFSALSLKGDFADLTLSGALSTLQKNPTGTLRLSGWGNLEEMVLLTGTLLSLPPDVRLSGDVNLSLSAEGDRRGLTLKGTTDFKNLDLNGDFLNNQPFRAASLKLEPDMLVSIADTTDSTINSLDIQSDVFDGTVKGTFGSDGTCALTGTLSSRLALLKKNLQGLLPASFPDAGQLVSDIELNGNLNKSLVIKGSHTIDGARFAAASFDGTPPTSGTSALALPGLTLVHDGQYDGDQDTLSLRMVQVDSSMGTARWSGTLSRLSQDLFMNGKGEMSLDMGEVVRVTKDFLPEDLDAKGKATITLSSEGSINPPEGVPLLASWSGNGALTAESADYLGIGSVRDLRSTKLSLNKGLLDAALECAIDGGPARMEVRCDCNREKPDVQMTAEVREMKLSKDMRLLGYIIPILIIPPDGELSGKGDFSVQASWKGTNWQSDIGRTMQGKGTLNINEGTIRSRSVLSLVLKTFNKPELLTFETMLTQFRLAEEKIYNDDIQVKAKDFTLNLKGWTSLVYVPSRRGNPLEYSVKGDVIQKAVGGEAGKVLSILGAEDMTIPVVIAGTVQDPTVSVKMPKAGDVLRGIFNSFP